MSEDSTETTDPIDQIIADADSGTITTDDAVLRMLGELCHAVRFAAFALEDLKDLAERTVADEAAAVH